MGSEKVKDKEKQPKRAKPRRTRTIVAWTLIVLGTFGMAFGGTHLYVAFATEPLAEAEAKLVPQRYKPLPLTTYQTRAMYVDSGLMIFGVAFLYVGIRFRASKKKDMWRIRQRCPLCKGLNPAWRFKCAKCGEVMDAI